MVTEQSRAGYEFLAQRFGAILREADERPVPDVAKKHGVSAQTIYGCRKHFGTLEPADVRSRARPLVCLQPVAVRRRTRLTVPRPATDTRSG